MASTAPVLLILGAGPKVGSAVAKTFLSKGYRVAIASRSLNDEKKSDNELSMKLDLSKPEDVPAVFPKVKSAFGAAPNVVVYNGKSISNALSPDSDETSSGFVTWRNGSCSRSSVRCEHIGKLHHQQQCQRSFGIGSGQSSSRGFQNSASDNQEDFHLHRQYSCTNNNPSHDHFRHGQGCCCSSYHECCYGLQGSRLQVSVELIYDEEWSNV